MSNLKNLIVFFVVTLEMLKKLVFPFYTSNKEEKYILLKGTYTILNI